MCLQLSNLNVLFYYPLLGGEGLFNRLDDLRFRNLEYSTFLLSVNKWLIFEVASTIPMIIAL